jgi:hypothetical protein
MVARQTITKQPIRSRWLLAGVLLLLALLGIGAGMMILLDGGFASSPSRYSRNAIYVSAANGGWIMAAIMIALGALALANLVILVRRSF